MLINVKLWQLQVLSVSSFAVLGYLAYLDIGSVNKRQDSHTNLIPHTNNCDMMDFNLTVLQSTSCMIL